jgi:triosephosphate isomerase
LGLDYRQEINLSQWELTENSMRPLIAANWKMHGSLDWDQKPAKFDKFLPASKRQQLDILICAPTLYSVPLLSAAKAYDIHIGAQNCHSADSGAHTGEISAKMLAGAGLSYVITGHSERRAAAETDIDVQEKASAALRHGLTPIICVGESLAEREAGQAMQIVSAQLKHSLPTHDGEIVIAYEPIWAIGTGRTAELSDIDAMHSAIRQLLVQTFGEEAAAQIRILYGGSVKPENAREILGLEQVDGALVGGASLTADSFLGIATAAVETGGE